MSFLKYNKLATGQFTTCKSADADLLKNTLD